MSSPAQVLGLDNPDANELLGNLIRAESSSTNPMISLKPDPCAVHLWVLLWQTTIGQGDCTRALASCVCTRFITHT